MKSPYTLTLLCLLSMQGLLVEAQHFPKNKGYPWVWVEAGQGFNQGKGGPKLYLATLQAVPQYTLIPGHLRGGLAAGGFYQGEKFGLLGGPRITGKLLEGKQVFTAASYNVHLFGEYLLGTRSGAAHGREWLGGGLGLELDDLIALSIKVHRDLRQPITYVQLGLAYHLTKYKPQPLPPVLAPVR